METMNKHDKIKELKTQINTIISELALLEENINQDIELVQISVRAKILNEINILAGSDSDLIFTRTRKFKPKMIRFSIMYILRTRLKYHLTTIGRAFLLDHSTVINAVNRMQEMIDVNDFEAMEIYNPIKKRYEDFIKNN